MFFVYITISVLERMFHFFLSSVSKHLLGSYLEQHCHPTSQFELL